jgi:hypothetical protein
MPYTGIHNYLFVSRLHKPELRPELSGNLSYLSDVGQNALTASVN